VERRVAAGRNRRVKDRPSTARASPRARRSALALAALAGLAACFAAAPRAWRALHEAQALRIRTVRFSGLARSTAEELLALSPVKPGDPFLFADLPSLEAALARHPWVKGVTARRKLPPSVEVAVEEHAPAALVELGGLYLVDAEGDVFKRAAAGDGLDLPLVTGLSRGDYVQRRTAAEPLLLGALALARAWRARGEKVPLSEIHVDPGDGVTLYVGEEGTQVRLGTGDYEAKLGRLEKILSALGADGKKAEVVHLDNRLHPSWVTVRLAGHLTDGGR
jgi:cell division protein FtsQ